MVCCMIRFQLRGKDGIARAIYVTALGQKLVIVRVFAKKTQATPQRDLDLAKERFAQVMRGRP